ncbi:hypothetical protein TBLA_0B05360 [Henningerozyma blattae CBS 6284]|uniref:S-adenosyl-L-methionine-dependent tRNA 4-demethylwyosine synthase n=1 Tax=Henningerozyma blattae (strain ATCC 34711 / CBS 6284 / DSM 70876 / NBRC 10599 / NRRL Y-10934 / UCD 77-7) TaxID=1071380 RepID=I2GZ16_HENB6|nr:hypothetical protein TBLA_0B05360 [Tetrapisispora blattae CBS 6284]CCH59368.1 hypothetical protein TBLA_0B05360 [Tetrapisispora blattae CBS 6284]
MDAIGKHNVSVAVGASAIAYCYFGGRTSFALVGVVLYDMFYSNYVFKSSSPTSANFVVEPEPVEKKKHKCCGGKGGSGCCSNKKDANDKAKKSCKCGHKKNTKESKTVPLSTGFTNKITLEKSIGDITNSTKDNSFPIAVDFTQSFKPKKTKGKKKDTSKKVIISKLPSKNSSEEDVSASQPIAVIDPSTVKSAMTVSTDKLINSQIYIFYSSLQGASLRVANRVKDNLSNKVQDLKYTPIVIHLDEIDDLDDFFVNLPSSENNQINSLYILVIPSYDTDCPLDYFLQTLQENFYDWRINKFPLTKLSGYTVLGLGDKESWPEKFCYQAKKVDHWLSKLGGRRIYPVGEICMKTEGDSKVDEWSDLLSECLKDDNPIVYQYEQSDDEDSDEENSEAEDEDLQDVEDIVKNGKVINDTDIKQMVSKNSPTFKQLKKQGYHIVGSHSGVKICRWTKSDLRGTGSCYKQSLFNITSSRCMELTPSLACSSKCVFCWRHGTNPVSKTWRWEVDEPEYILENALKGHYAMIKQMRGVPGVVAERFQKAFKVGHCALSLVGEPIMYPYINRFVELLHEKEITSFLVCNAQHPEPLENLGKVTQLYVSIDAPTKDELRKVDRPLFKDFWERMLQCLDILNTKQHHQRTVFRLTLVKGFNMGDISAYADLVQRGSPCFIEVKGATFSGTSKSGSNPLTMQNIPFYEECTNFVKEFAKELQRRGLDYDLAAEHAHSNCILLAHKKFQINGEWYTHIDFAKFFELLNSGKDFTHMDYMAKTPEWALFGNGGFAPGNTRVYRKGKNKQKKQDDSSQVDTNMETTIKPGNDITDKMITTNEVKAAV